MNTTPNPRSPKARCYRCGETDYRTNMVRTDSADLLTGCRMQTHEHPECRRTADAAARTEYEAERQRRIEISKAAQAQAADEGHEPGSLAHAFRSAEICQANPDY